MSATTPRIGLALGGGGARGLAHIVLLEVLDELGLTPAAVAGTSMGAVIGAAAAGGLTGREIRAHCLRVLRNRRVLLGRMLEARVGRFTDMLRRGLVNPVLLDAELFLPLVWPEGLPATLDAMPIPLSIVATDFDARAEVLIERGDLMSALAASIAIPGLVKPVLRDGLRLIDGGTVDPLPYECLLPRTDCTIACDVATGHGDEPRGGIQSVGVMLGAAQIMQGALTARMLRAQAPDLLVRPAVERFRLLDFFYASRILEAAEAGKDRLKRDVAAAVERSITRAAPIDAVR